MKTDSPAGLVQMASRLRVEQAGMADQDEWGRNQVALLSMESMVGPNGSEPSTSFVLADLPIR